VGDWDKKINIRKRQEEQVEGCGGKEKKEKKGYQGNPNKKEKQRKKTPRNLAGKDIAKSPQKTERRATRLGPNYSKQNDRGGPLKSLGRI